MTLTLEHTLSLRGTFGDMHVVSPHCTCFLPHSGVLYHPVLIHMNMNEATLGSYAFVKDVIESDCPPLVVFTNGNKTDNVREFLPFLEERGLKDSFNVILSIANTCIPWGTYASLNKNLPVELEDLLSPLFPQGGISKGASRIGEVISLAFDKPCVSMHFDGSYTEEYDSLWCFLKTVPEFPDWKYKSYMLSSCTKQGKCALCGKHRGPQKFFYSIQGNLCPVCEQKIKAHGSVNIRTFALAQRDLRMERMTTRSANLQRQLNEATHKCPICGHPLLYGKRGTLVCTNCNRTFFTKEDKLVELKVNGFLYTYSRRRLVHIEPVSETTSIKRCWSCGKPTAMGLRYEAKDGGAYILCEDCDWHIRKRIKETSANAEMDLE